MNKKTKDNVYKAFIGEAKAYFRLLAYADRARARLLSTTLTDVERFVLLNERQRYLEDVGSKDELQVVEEELKRVRRRLEYYANWSEWARHWSEW